MAEGKKARRKDALIGIVPRESSCHYFLIVSLVLASSLYPSILLFLTTPICRVFSHLFQSSVGMSCFPVCTSSQCLKHELHSWKQHAIKDAKINGSEARRKANQDNTWKRRQHKQNAWQMYQNEHSAEKSYRLIQSLLPRLSPDILHIALAVIRLVCLACFSWKLVGIRTTATAVAILEVALLVRF